MNCPSCSNPMIRWGKYWLCNNCKLLRYPSAWREFRENWFIFVRYGFMLSAFSTFIGILTSGNPWYTFILGAIFGGFLGGVGREWKKIRKQ